MVKAATTLMILLSSVCYSQCDFIKYDTIGCDKVTMDINRFTYYYKCEKNLKAIGDTLIVLKRNNQEIKSNNDSIVICYENIISIKDRQIENSERKRRKATVLSCVISSFLATLLIITNI